MKKHIIFLTLFLSIVNFLPISAMEADSGETTPLISAVRQNDFEFIKAIVELGSIDINEQDLDWSTALLEAIQMCQESGDFKIVNYLIDHGARGDIKDGKERTAFDLAVEYGFDPVVKRLSRQEKPGKTKKQILATMVNESVRIIESGFKASCYASLRYLHRKNAKYQKKALRKYFRNIKKESQIDNAHSPLIVAIENNNLEAVVTLLSDPMTNVNVKGMGWAALALAAQQGNLKIVEALVDHKDIVLDAPSSSQDWTALMEAIFAEHFEIVKLLVEKGANINAVNNLGATVLILAVQHGTPEIIDLLLSFNDDEEKKLHINDKNSSGYTALFYAAQKNNFDLVKKLVNLGAIIEDASMETSPLNPIHKRHPIIKQEINQEIIEFLQKALEERTQRELIQEEIMPDLESDEDNDEKETEKDITTNPNAKIDYDDVPVEGKETDSSFKKIKTKTKEKISYLKRMLQRKNRAQIRDEHSLAAEFDALNDPENKSYDLISIDQNNQYNAQEQSLRRDSYNDIFFEKRDEQKQKVLIRDRFVKKLKKSKVILEFGDEFEFIFGDIPFDMSNEEYEETTRKEIIHSLKEFFDLKNQTIQEESNKAIKWHKERSAYNNMIGKNAMELHRAEQLRKKEETEQREYYAKELEKTYKQYKRQNNRALDLFLTENERSKQRLKKG